MNSFSKANPYFAGPILARVGEMYSEVDSDTILPSPC